MKPKIIFFVGRSGCGKGTQIDFLKKETGFALVNTGDLLRKRAESEDFLGKKIKEIMLKGGLIPTPLVFSVWMPLLVEFYEKGVSGIIFDGNPRKLYEGYMLEEVFALFDWEDVTFYHLKISEDEARKRLLKRGRNDDIEEDIKERMDWFKKEVEPVINHYREKGLLIEIDGEQSIENVWKDIKENLDLKKK
jgi:adenylate kinase